MELPGPSPNAGGTVVKKVGCPPCGTEISAEKEEELVLSVQDHAKREHGHELTREHILAAAEEA